MNNVREEWSMACPECGRDDALDIEATVIVRLVPDGTVADESGDGSHTWDGESPIDCLHCGWSGQVRDACVKEKADG